VIIAIVAILSLLLGFAAAAVIGIGVISSQLTDLKTQIRQEHRSES
jgi:hypothetical protein